MTGAQDDKKKGKDNLPVCNSPEQFSKTNITSLTHNHSSDQACAMVLLKNGNKSSEKGDSKTS